MNQDSFGEYLKRERQMRGVSLEEICAATRISVRFLEALEAEQWDVLPGGVFNRGFVRAVARFLGLDEEDLVAQYVAATKEKTPAPVLLSQPVKAKSTSAWLPWVAVLALFALAAAGWFAWQWRAKTLQSESAAATAAAKAIPAPPAPPPLAAAAPDAGALPSDSSAEQNPPAPEATDQLQLKLEAGKATAVTVTADGQKVFDGNLAAGENRTFVAQSAFEVSAQDAGALLLELNGQTLAPIGPPGQPGKVTVTRRDLKPASGGAN